MQPARPRLGQLLVEANILTPAQLEAVLVQQKHDSRKLGQLLIDSGLVSETRITQILSQQLSVPWVSLYHIDFSHELLAMVRRDIAEQYGLIPIYARAVRGQGDTLYVAMEDPMNEEALRDCAQCAGLPTRAMIAAPSEIRRAIRIYYGASDSFRAARAAATSPPARAVAAPVSVDASGGATGATAAGGAASGAPTAASDAPTGVAATGAGIAGTSTTAGGAPATGAGVPPLVTSGRTAEATSGVTATGAAAAATSEATVTGEAMATTGAAAEGERGAALDAPSQRSEVPLSDDGPVLEVHEVDLSKRSRKRKQVELTLLDGTTLRLPSAARSKGSAMVQGDASAAEIVEALRTVARGGQSSDVLGENLRWEKMMAVVLDLLLRKHLIQERELIEALKK